MDEAMDARIEQALKAECKRRIDQRARKYVIQERVREHIASGPSRESEMLKKARAHWLYWDDVRGGWDWSKG